MPDKKTSTIKIIDKAIYVFIIIFLLSISNSIFVNQIGYYGALILLLIKAYISKENQFSKTGLEFAIIWYIIAEILSTIFSQEKPLSFHNLLKHTLLIPLIYTMLAAVKDFSRAKTLIKIYLGGTLITVGIYLYFALQFYLQDLYGKTESGPSLFQYPITASEIISFTVIFLFSFLVNEKTSLRNKLFLFLGFALSTLALFSTYKRTGWMGAAFGILLILIIKKQWKILAAGVVLLILFFITQKNISQVDVFSIKNDSLKIVSSLKTDGKAYDVYKLNNDIIISDYNKGLEVFRDSILINHYKMPSAAIRFFHWKDDYYVCNLIDTRYILFKYQNDSLHQLNEFYTPGYTYSDDVANGFLYVMDKDSGLTVFTTPDSVTKFIRFPFINNYSSVFVDSNYLVAADPEGYIKFYKLENKLPEATPIYTYSTKYKFIYFSNNNLFLERKKGLEIFEINYPFNIKFLNSIEPIKQVSQIIPFEGKYFVLYDGSKIFVLDKNQKQMFDVVKKLSLTYNPKSIAFADGKLYSTRVENKQSRLLGIFDPYHPSNFNRLSLWRAGIKIFLDHPVFGVGDIDLAGYYKQYKEPYHKEIQGHLHNNFFHVLATLGLFGLLAVLYLFYKIILIDFKIYSQLKGNAFASSFALGTLAAFCGFIISGLTELNFWDHEIATLIWFTFGLNIAIFKSVKPDKKI